MNAIILVMLVLIFMLNRSPRFIGWRISRQWESDVIKAEHKHYKDWLNGRKSNDELIHQFWQEEALPRFGYEIIAVDGETK
jgi:uncharacterized membrane protein YbaN (DUF454 family)